VSGVLSLATPWAKRPFPTWDSRMEVEGRVPDGYTVQVYCNSDGSQYGVRVIEHGETAFRHRVVWGGDHDRHYYRDVHVGIADALAWIEWNRLGAASVTLEAAG
jgi:hypothetical protein